MRATELPEATLYRRGGAIEYLSAATKSDAACARFRRGYAQLTAGPSCRSSTWRGGFRFSGAGGHRIPERVSPKTMLQVTRNSLRLRAWKSIAYVRSRKTATASSSKNSSAGTMATQCISQSGSFKITMSKFGTVIVSCSGWNAKDDDERRATRRAPDRDGCSYSCGDPIARAGI